MLRSPDQSVRQEKADAERLPQSSAAMFPPIVPPPVAASATQSRRRGFVHRFLLVYATTAPSSRCRNINPVHVPWDGKGFHETSALLSSATIRRHQATAHDSAGRTGAQLQRTSPAQSSPRHASRERLRASVPVSQLSVSARPQLSVLSCNRTWHLALGV